MKNQGRGKRIMIVAGEASGDLHGRRLVRAMARKDPELSFAGIGGPGMAGAGVEILFDAAELSVVGITEALVRLPQILAGAKTARSHMAEARPDLLILIDFPDFNLYLASFARRLGIPVLYYISPQIWAWRSGRVRRIRRLVDHMAVILPFEERFYRKNGVPVTFVGHPLMDGKAGGTGAALCPEGKGAVGLFPGSRRSEVKNLLPAMLDAALIIAERAGAKEFLIPLAPTVDPRLVEEILRDHPAGPMVTVVASGLEAVLSRASVAVAASGTVNLEIALSGVPMVVIYRVSRLSYWLGRALIRVKHISLVNLIAGRAVVPELIQDDASAERIAGEAIRILEDGKIRGRVKRDLSALRRLMGRGGASLRTAEIALGLLRRGGRRR